MDHQTPLYYRGVRLVALVCLLLTGFGGLSRAAAAPPSPATCRRHHLLACLTPAALQAYYGVAGLLRRGIEGQGTTIALIESFGSPTLRADLAVFDRAFGLPDPALTVLAPLGRPPSVRSGWAVETTLDAEVAHALAPRARIVVLESPTDETEGVQGMPQFLALEQYALRRHAADVISQSWGASEETLMSAQGRRIVAAFHRFYTEAAARGVTAVAASGDDGAANRGTSRMRFAPRPAVNYPAADPAVLAVGGTQLSVDRAGRVVGERAWDRSGGGRSALFGEPAYQRALRPVAQRLLAGRRGVPDVAADAAPSTGVLIYVRGRWHVAGGTSASAPAWAALIALADGLAGHGLGSVNAALYRLACAPGSGHDFRDITVGASLGPLLNGRRLGGVGFKAGPGWDAVTGLGSPRAAFLVPDLARGTAQAPAPPSAGACSDA